MMKTSNKNIIAITAMVLAIALPTIGYSDDDLSKNSKQRTAVLNEVIVEYQVELDSKNKEIKSHLSSYISKNYTRCKEEEINDIRIMGADYRYLNNRSIPVDRNEGIEIGISRCIFHGFTKGSINKTYFEMLGDEIELQVSTKVEAEKKDINDAISAEEDLDAERKFAYAEEKAIQLAMQLLKLENLLDRAIRDDIAIILDQRLDYKVPFASTDADDCSSKNATGS